MSVRKLSDEVQSLFCSSSNLTSYKEAVEELVYNSLDAKATSIAIRIHIEQNKIQVVDNGSGIGEQDFILIGEWNATSKYVDISNFKSAPNTYGFRGQSLASIVDISKHVKITSRLQNQEVTWAKIYHKGKQKDLIKTTSRPSKGTTVEINGFLYNLNVQNKLINVIQELSAIKNFLKQLSLVYNNVSLSLRDDNENAILFKMHKNRDVYQIFQLLFNIDKTSIQEIKVEKNEYKACAFIGKSNDCNSHHWIFLNKRFVNNCKLHKLVTNNFSKYLHHISKNKKQKSKNSANLEDFGSAKDCIPFYVIFLTCPYYDYDINRTQKQSTVEFKVWNPISKLIEKLISFYAGDINLLKEIKTNYIRKSNPTQQTDIRDQVRKIMNKILGSNSKKVGVSQMQNGIKGKLIKRKKKKSSKITNSKDLREKDPSDDNYGKNEKLTYKINRRNINTAKKNKSKEVKFGSEHTYILNNDVSITSKTNFKDNSVHTNQKEKNKEYLREKKQTTTLNRPCEKKIETFDEHLIGANKKAETEVNDNEIVQYRKLKENNKNISVLKRVGDFLTDKIFPPSKKCRLTKLNIERKKGCDIIFYKSYDLVKTVLGTQKDVQCYTPNLIHPINNNFADRKDPLHDCDDKIPPTITFQSHHYNSNRAGITNLSICNNETIDNRKNNEFILVQETPNVNQHKKANKINFISKQSRENFAMPKVYQSSFHKSKKRKNTTRKCPHNLKNNMNSCKWAKYYDVNDTSAYTIEVPKSVGIATNYRHKKYYSINRAQNIQIDGNNEINSKNIRFTYTLTSSNITTDNNLLKDNEYSKYDRSGQWISNVKKHSVDSLNPRNVVFVSNFQNSSTHVVEHNFSKAEIKNARVFHKATETSFIHENHEILNDPCDVNPVQTNKSSKSYQVFMNNSDDNVSLVAKGYSHDINQGNNDSQAGIINYFSNSSRLIDVNYYRSDIDPLNVCQTIISDCSKDDYKTSVFDKSLNPVAKVNQNNLSNHDVSFILENAWFTNERFVNKTISQKSDKNNKELITISNDEPNGDFIMQSNYFHQEQVHNNVQEKDFFDRNTFNMKTRFHFIPKGMSPIFEICNSKNKGADDNNSTKRYFENELYNNFINHVQTNTEVYEAKVQNAKDVTTKAIEKVNIRLDKDNSFLTFNKSSLKEATVLGQVDNKFIATLMKGKSDHGSYLVLFDQHAVHERIRLEHNLSGYIKDNKWESVILDDVKLKLTEDEIIYLHNYKEKFTNYGIEWTVLNNNEININSIPAAVLGQNSREVEKIMIAVKKLITEEINNITSQKGCVSLYPKAIMDLVFNEACRYAIKFGDVLSKKEIIDLIASLSTCKVPFQCAHGRPVMAIIMDIKTESRQYQINPKTLQQFKMSWCKK